MLQNLNFTAAFPAIAVMFLLLFFIYYFCVFRPRKGTLEWIALEADKKPITFSLRRYPLTKGDIFPMLFITICYAAVAFFYLGNTRSPESFHRFTEDAPEVTLELDSPVELGRIDYFTGLWTGGYQVFGSADGKSWQELTDESNTTEVNAALQQEYANLFKWRTAVFASDGAPIQYLRIVSTEQPMELGEIALYDNSGARISSYSVTTADGTELLDEPTTVPETEECLNSAYFDEIYHVRTAYEHILGEYPYEISHPPLGKLIIALGITIFGLNPFGWRFMGTLFGVLMLPVLYAFLKNLFGKRYVSVCGTLLLAFEFMHFTQTRIATIDTYGVFFILLMYWMMYRYFTVPADAPFRKSVLPLFLSGLFFGIGCACKWIVLYGGAGLALLWLLFVVMKGRDMGRAGNSREFSLWLSKTVLLCIPFFILIPTVIYVLSYIPYGIASGMEVRTGMLWDPEYYQLIWQNQVFMFTYHSGLVATHPYSSCWYQWIFDIRPILYYRRYEADNTVRSAISAFGNPAVWWGGIGAFVAMIHRILARRDGKALFLVIGFLTQLLPWVFISRIVFIYHYFPSTIFLILMLACVFDTVGTRGSRKAVYCYTLGAGILFALFYPSLSGYPVLGTYTDYFLRWLSTWPL